MMPYTYYNFWFLPQYQQEYADKYLLFNDISEAELKVFQDTFTKLIKISFVEYQRHTVPEQESPSYRSCEGVG